MSEQQEELNVSGPGVAPVDIAEINAAMEVYEDARDKRCKLTKKETDAKDVLITLLHEHEVTIGKGPDGAIRYKHKGKIAELVPTDEKLTVKRIPKEED
jgi:hypothetical protein